MTGGIGLGHRLRHLRQRNQNTQAQVARRLGISASYLNLIENNRRPLTPDLLHRLAHTYGIEEQVLLADEPGRLRRDLAAACGDPAFPSPRLGDRDLTDLVATMPDAARAVLALYQAYLGARAEAGGVGERIAGDPFMIEARHRLLTLLTSIHSYAEILRDNTDLAPPRRQRFVGVLVEESENLTALAHQIFDFLATDGAAGLDHARSPAAEMADDIAAHNNHFPDLEDAADGLRASLTGAPASLYTAIVEVLRRQHGVAVEISPDDSAMAALGAPLVLGEALPQESRTFRAARHLALLSRLPALERRVTEAGVSPAATELYRHALGGYLAAAMMMPYAPFHQAAATLRHDLERLQRRFGASFEQVCRRLATLQRPGAEGVPFHVLRVDIAGNLAHSFSASGLPIPRHGGLCPRWNVHLAFLSAGRIDTQIAQFPDGSRYLFIAQAMSKAAAAGAPRSHHAVAIGCDVAFAPRLVYADGLPIESAVRDVPVGTTCRQCPRRDCAQRVGPISAMTTDAGPQ